ncbi:hypothetical protein Tco_0419288 [Tanacetum coccineum]
MSPDRVFDFPEDELEPHPVYDFFAPALLLGYASNPNNNNGWLAADDYLLGELEAMVNEQMVVPAIEEISEPVVEAEEDQVIALVIDMEEGQMDALMMDIEDDLAALLVDDDFEDDASDGFGEEEVWEVNRDWLMAHTTPPSMLAVPPPSAYEVGGPSTVVAEGPSFPHSALRLHVPLFVIEDLSTRLGNLEYGHGQLVQRVNQVSDAEVADGVTIGELGPRVYAVEGHTTVTEMSSRESTLMRCILGLERRIAALERRPPGPDIYGDHASTCAGIIGIKHHRNVMRDTLVNICYFLGISADMTGSSPLTQTRMADFVHGRAVIVAAQCKHVKYMAKCTAIGYGFLPFSFSSLGELEEDAVTLMNRIRKFSMVQDNRAHVDVYIFMGISFAIAKRMRA